MMEEPSTTEPVSPFFQAGLVTKPNTLALLPLRRDLIQPAILSADKDAVCNTRFGSYPHSTLLDIPWGSQVLASKLVQDNQRGRGKKRKAAELAAEEDDEEGLVILGAASSGFTHVLPPTPELWTQGLPHRTQVVYIPDYSYILHRLKVRPGSVVIEAGAGSGSFTHAAARAAYNGTGLAEDANGAEHGSEQQLKKRRKKWTQGKVYSFEYHEQRAQQLASELKSHRLQDVVRVTHQDVYEHGFNLYEAHQEKAHEGGVSPEATAIFLDLPAPWLALKHLRRSIPMHASETGPSKASSGQDITTSRPFVSPLSSSAAVYICTFSPCIEQVSRTVSTLRELGWVDVDMVELAHRRIDVRRVRYGVAEEGSRDGNPVPSTVEEAVGRLRDVKAAEEKARADMKEREAQIEQELGVSKDEAKDEVAKALKKKAKEARMAQGKPAAKSERLERLEKEREGRKFWTEGKVVMRMEPEMKTHTSYLVFATLPREWTGEDERLAAEKVRRLTAKET